MIAETLATAVEIYLIEHYFLVLKFDTKFFVDINLCDACYASWFSIGLQVYDWEGPNNNFFWCWLWTILVGPVVLF